MMRERNIQNFTYASGGSQILDLPRDAVFHIIQIQGTGVFSNVQGASGTGVILADDFPFSLLKNIRLIRNGSDVVFQGSGGLIAAEHYYLNERFPHARIYKVASSVETLLLSTAALAIGGKGVTVPANAEGIGCKQVQFASNTNANMTETLNFDFQVDLYLQMGPDDGWFGTLVEARVLSTFQLVLDYANVTDISIPGTTNTNTVTMVGRVLSYDQDNLDVDNRYGTFKRSQMSLTNIPYGTSNFQVVLPRGNYFQGLILDTLAAKAASTTVLSHENAVIVSFINRLNTNFQLRVVNFEDLQRKNQADGCVMSAFSGSRGCPNGQGYLYFPSVGDQASELIPTAVLDIFDLQLTLGSSTTVAGPSNAGVTGPENGVTTGSTNPTINILLEEIIPGVSMGAGAPRGAQAGSTRATSAKPYSNR